MKRWLLVGENRFRLRCRQWRAWICRAMRLIRAMRCLCPGCLRQSRWKRSKKRGRGVRPTILEWDDSTPQRRALIMVKDLFDTAGAGQDAGTIQFRDRCRQWPTRRDQDYGNNVGWKTFGGETMNQVRSITVRFIIASFAMCLCFVASALAQTPSPSPSPESAKPAEAKPATQAEQNPFAPEPAALYRLE